MSIGDFNRVIVHSPPAASVILVASGKGGVGKSTISLNLALALAQQGASVGLLDADVYAPDIPLMVNLTRTQHRKQWPMYTKGLRHVRFEPVECFGLKIMSVGFMIAEDQSLTFPAESIEFVLNQIVNQVQWGRLDHLVVDLPPGTADVQQHLVRLLHPSGALIVVGSQDASHLDAKKVVTMFREQGVRVLGGIENMHALQCPHCDSEVELFPRVRESRSIWSSGVEQLAALPFEPQLVQAAERGQPLLVAAPESAQAERFRQLAARVAGALGEAA
jgi:ATP-binding protein involved in chromosome partitioning